MKFEFNKLVLNEIVQMNKIARLIDPEFEAEKLINKFPPKPVGMDRIDYLELKAQYYEEQEKAFKKVFDDIRRVFS